MKRLFRELIISVLVGLLSTDLIHCGSATMSVPVVTEATIKTHMDSLSYQVRSSNRTSEWTLTDAGFAQADFASSTDPLITLTKGGTYRIVANLCVKYSGAYYLGTSERASFKLRRINNTASDLSNTAIDVFFSSATHASGDRNASAVCTNLSANAYTTTNADDQITVFGTLTSGAADGGTIVVNYLDIYAQRVFGSFD